MRPTTVKMGIFKSGPRPLGMVKWTLGGQFGPVLTHRQRFWPILAQFLPGPGVGTVTEPNLGPKPVKTDFFPKWPGTLWKGQTDVSGPFWAHLDQFYGYTGYRILDTGHRYTGQRAGVGVCGGGR